MKRLFHISCLVLSLWLGAGQSALARSLIRDAEIEHTLRQMSTPIFQAAGIRPDSVRIFLINDDSINAFVAGGQNIFFHTGLLTKIARPEMLLGVIAHETGHISGAHLTQLTSAANDATLGAILSYILGAAAILGGSPQVGGAVMSAGQNTSLRTLLSHYRGNEQQADQAAIKYLKSVNLSPAGMLEMFELLRRKEHQQIGSGGDPYLRTHPLTTDRIAALRSEVRTSEANAAPPPEITLAFERLQAKLSAFLSSPEETLRRYPPSEISQSAHLARAVAYFKRPDLPRALEEIDALLALSPDAFSHDLKGQILFENGEIAAAIKAYERANELAPENGLILTELGKAYLASGTSENLLQAVKVLERAARQKDAQATTHRQLATAYGKQGKLGKSYLSLAREAALLNEPKLTIRYAEQAKLEQQDDPILQLHADDLIEDARRAEKMKDNG